MTIRILFRDTALLPINVTVSKDGWADLSSETLDVLDLNESGDDYFVAQFERECVYGWMIEREMPENAD